MTMPKKTIPRIEAVEPGARPLTLHIRWAHGDESLVDLSGLIGAFRVFTPLRSNPALFATVKVGEYGTHIAWNDDIDMAASSLWRLAQEQSGATMSAEAFRQWREGHAFTLETAARALGVSRRMLTYYEQGQKPVPRTIALATRGLDAG
jgi:DNA-binding transcriptional regulator YiaG